MNFEFPKITSEYIEECCRKGYDDDRAYPENFSNWYPHIKDFGVFKHSEIISHQIFTYEETKILNSNEHKDNTDWNLLTKILKPTLDRLKPDTLYNIKNGCYSNKFDFNTCITDKHSLPDKFWDINYMSTMFDTGGFTELVVRSYIPYDPTTTLTIYHGMPLREELRVFYNMDTKEIEYIVDYWDYNYCYENISNITDKIVFKHFHNIEHNAKLLKYENEIRQNIQTLKFDDTLTGIWSIDFMSCNNNLYLIDMARGFRSAYWDPSKLKTKETKEN